MFAASAKHSLALSCLINPDAFAEVDRMASEVPRGYGHHRPPRPDRRVRGTIESGATSTPSAPWRSTPGCIVKVGAFYALGKKAPPYLDLAPLIRRVVQAFGAERCMWESDCPFQVVRDSYLDSISLVRDRLDFLTADQKDWLLRRTAERVLFRD